MKQKYQVGFLFYQFRPSSTDVNSFGFIAALVGRLKARSVEYFAVTWPWIKKRFNISFNPWGSNMQHPS
jgi:hypothetical protein